MNDAEKQEAHAALIDQLAEGFRQLYPDDELEDAVLTGAVIVTQWHSGDAQSLLSLGLNADGSQMPSWDQSGFLMKILGRTIPSRR